MTPRSIGPSTDFLELRRAANGGWAVFERLSNYPGATDYFIAALTDDACLIKWLSDQLLGSKPPAPPADDIAPNADRLMAAFERPADGGEE